MHGTCSIKLMKMKKNHKNKKIGGGGGGGGGNVSFKMLLLPVFDTPSNLLKQVMPTLDI